MRDIEAYIRKGSDLIHEGLNALWNLAILVLKLSTIEVELFNAVELASLTLPSQPSLESCKDTGLRIPKKPLLVCVGDVAVQVLSEVKLPLKLIKRDTIVRQIQEAVIFNGSLRKLDQVINNLVIG